MRLKENFFRGRNTIDIAKDLLGKVIVYNSNTCVLKGIICETEAYTQDDESCHAYGGRRTKRNEVMFYRYGHLYIYFTYGMYYCANIVTDDIGKGEAVLIRSIIPILGKNTMIVNRKGNAKDITNGPSKFCMAFQLNKEHNGIDLLSPTSTIYLDDESYFPKEIIKSKRIGISKAIELEWRFTAKEFERK